MQVRFLWDSTEDWYWDKYLPPGLLSYGLTPWKFSIHQGAGCPAYICMHVKGYCMPTAFSTPLPSCSTCPYYDSTTTPIPKTVDHKISNTKKCLQHSMDLLKAFHTINCALLGDSATQPYPWLVGFTLALVIMRQCRDCTFLAFFNNHFIDFHVPRGFVLSERLEFLALLCT